MHTPRLRRLRHRRTPAQELKRQEKIEKRKSFKRITKGVRLTNRSGL